MMWIFIRLIFVFAVLSFTNNIYGQFENNPYQIGDTIIVNALVKDAYRANRDVNGSQTAQLVGSEAVEIIQCLLEKYGSTDDKLFRLGLTHLSLFHPSSINLPQISSTLFTEQNINLCEQKVKKRFGILSPLLINIYKTQANIYLMQKNNAATMHYTCLSCDLVHKTYSHCSPQYNCLYDIGHKYQQLNMPDSAIYWFQQSAQWSLSEMGESYITAPHSYNRIGLNYQYLNQNDSAYKYYKLAIQSYKKARMDEMESIQWTYHNLVHIAYDFFHPYSTECVKYFEEYSQLYDSLPWHERLPAPYWNVLRKKAYSLANLDSSQQAIKLLDKVIKGYQFSQKNYTLKSSSENYCMGQVLNSLAIIHSNESKKELANWYEYLAKQHFDKENDSTYVFYTGPYKILYAQNALEANNYQLAEKYIEDFRKLLFFAIKKHQQKIYRYDRLYLEYCNNALANLKLCKLEKEKNELLAIVQKHLKASTFYPLPLINSIVITLHKNNYPIPAHIIYNKIYANLEKPIYRGCGRLKADGLIPLAGIYKNYHLDSSLHIIQDAIRYIANDSTLNTLDRNADISQIHPNHYPVYASAQLLKAQLLYDLPANDPRRQYAHASLDLAEQTADAALINLKNNYDRVAFLKNLRAIIETRMIRYLSQKDTANAYQTIVKNRSRILFLHYAEQKANQLNTIQPHDRYVLDSLTNAINAMDIKIKLLSPKQEKEKEIENQIKALNYKIIACDKKRMDILHQIEANIPEYVAGLNQKPFFDYPQFHSRFWSLPENNNKAILEYFQTKDSLYIYCLTPVGLKLKTFGISDAVMAKQADHFIASIADSFPKFFQSRQSTKLAQNYKEYINQSYGLYQNLLAPYAQEIKNKDLIIIPDGAIWKIPMEALLEISSATQRDSLIALYSDLEINAYQSLPYLIKNHSFERQLSLAKNTSETQQKTTYQYDLIAFAPVFEDKTLNDDSISTVRRFLNGIRFHGTRSFAVRSDESGQNLSITPLIETKTEVKNIKHIITQTNPDESKAKVFLYNDATESQFKALQNQSVKFLHIATHGFANINQPNLSGLIFIPDSTTANLRNSLKEDGILYAGEIQNLKYPSYLVTLSACETGKGKIVSGEGILGLMYGFMQAGTQNVTSTYWTVNDKATAQLMTQFYSSLQRGHSPANALRNSQIHILKKTYSAPYFWASFSAYKL